MTADHKIKNSRSLLLSLAEQRGLAGLLHGDSPLSFGDRFEIRHQLDQAARQKNLESIVSLASENCNDEVGNDPDPDWLSRYLELAENIRHPAMQHFWASILTQEIRSPGHCSIQSLSCLRQMTQKDALLLQKASALGCHFGDDNLRLLFGYQYRTLLQGRRQQKLNLGRHRLPYAGLLQLFELGLLHQAELESGELSVATPLRLEFNSQQMTLHPHKKGVRLLYYRFTTIGNELASLMTESTPADYRSELQELLAPLGQLSQK
ncbi:TIGR03899 family protein [Oceanisphaera psychrotolerans]|uniref:TIGR03899 family protein n=1 Tax=Oceanisphaera psychrotolerans TaxID=1414654 RepID=A0A1J4QGX6_9GAMM|nr:TIGR03899 family protein [Oceanisphaera psychrotolerans]OIN09630.1 TIGR03899 family protein [Oceanisphaera psychrotolerans]